MTGKKFYDLNKDPVISPYTGKSYPLSFFEAAQEKTTAKFGAKARKDEGEQEVKDEATVEEADVDVAAKEAGAEIISLDDAEDKDEDSDDEEVPDVEDVEVDEELGGDDDDSFLESDDDDDDNKIEFDVETDDDER